MTQTLRTAAFLALITALWCWLLSALHGIWSFGIVLGYLDGGMVPLYPSWPVSYWGFFMDAILAFVLPLMLVFTVCIVVPAQRSLIVILIAWAFGAWVGAANVSFIYQIDFGTTWSPWEAVTELFVHPVFTPIWLVVGLVGAASLTRPLRKGP